MTDVIQIHLTQANRAVLEQLEVTQATVLDDVVNQALSAYLVGVRFDQLRSRLNQTTETTPSYTEADIFEIVS